MDVYDPQTLGIMVFGGFMVFSAIGITLVSTFSMKETSYEEALAKQQQESGKTPTQRSDKKKKASEKKNKARKKEDKPNGKLPESEPESYPETEPEPVVKISESGPAPQVEPETQPESVTNPKSEVTPKQPVPEPFLVPEVAKCTSPPDVCAVVAPSAPSPKKKKKKVAKVQPAPAKPVEIPEVVVKEEPVVAKVAVKAEVAPDVVAPPQAEEPKLEPKPEVPTKKKSKKKADPVVTVEMVDVPLLSPFKTLVTSLNNSSFNESEMQKLLEIISKKAGKDSWQLASQKGDPLASLKKQLEDKEKQLTAEQDNIAAAKTRVRELTKELSSAKSKMTSVETRMSSELNARGQEIAALQARMQASYQEHVLETQQLNSKIQSLQEQFENGPNAQLARLQQENSILRDALNQATSQAESRQNAELAKMRQDCVHLNQELKECKVAQHADEDRRKALETKIAAAEEELAQTKANRVEAEQVLQQKLDKVSDELRQAQDNSTTLHAQLDGAKEQTKTLTELQERMRVTEADLKDRCEELELLRAQLSQTTKGAVETEAPETQRDNSEEVEQLKTSLKEREDQQTTLQAELTQLREELDTVKKAQSEAAQNRKNEAETERREYTAEIEQLKTSLKEKEDLVASTQAQMEQMESTETVESEPPFENLEKDARMISLEEELQQLKEEMERMKNKSNELQEKNYTTVEALAAAERLSEERLSQARAAQSEVEQKLSSFQTEARNALQTLFPHITIETHQNNWLEAFTHEALVSLTHSQKCPTEEQTETSSTELMELQHKLAQSEESQRSLHAECEQYRSTLSKTESVLQVLQKSVEDGELMRNSKSSDAEEQKQAALDQVTVLKETIEMMKVERQDTDQLKGQVMLLEAQLEKQLESITISQTYAEEMSQMKALLSETQSQLELSKAEAQKQKAEFLLVQTQLEEATNKLQTKEDIRQQLVNDYEQAQKCVRDLEVQLEQLKAVEEGATEELKERLEKESKLTQDLGQAATKLQQLPMNTQEELTKEKETVMSLQEQHQDKEIEEIKEGTSV
ncbi:ribosome-binding protein 1b [Xyrauchen texanus]|uniref:ribosome-binding protein 1b n=1 Tax=Xyrauchen texanus TaxID=154827 RepID=UPI002241CB66|nr:ribosome-binding protein 1b [Xyrauchen texanus]